jgi:hypothetical protein
MSAKQNEVVATATVVATEVVVENTAVSAAPNTALAAPTSTFACSVNSDIEIPRLNVIQKMSEVEGDVGSVVLDKQEQIIDAKESISVIIVGAHKRFKEDIPFDEEKVPQIVDTQEEADMLAKTSDYPVLEFADITMLIPQPEGVSDELFPYEIDGVNYQLGKITVQKDAYRMTFKRLFTFHVMNRTVPLATRYWKFGTDLISKGKYSWYVPTLTATKDDVPAEVLEFVKALTEGGVA